MALTGSKQMSKAKARRQDHHDKTKKYEKQKERTAYNKIRARLLNAARNDKKLLAAYVAGNGGWKKILLMAQNVLNMEGYIEALSSRAGVKKAGKTKEQGTTLTVEHIKAAKEALERNSLLDM